MATDIDKFVHDQLSVWPAVAAKYRALKSAQTRQMTIGGILVTLQSNPGRMPIFDHGCPLCEENYMERQHFLPFEGRKGRKYRVLVNRAPIFPNHLVITRDVHVPQTIWHRYPDMLDLAVQFPDDVIFYNSPFSGTTVPGHAHFQACPKGYMPMERIAGRLLHSVAVNGGQIPESLENDITFVASVRDAQLFHYKHFTRGIFLLRAETSKSMAKMFYRLLDCCDLAEGETEPRFNALTFFSEGEYRAVVMCRAAHRPHHYYAEGEDHFALSPGAADMAGFFVIPEVSDYERLTPEILTEILQEISLSEKQEDTPGKVLIMEQLGVPDRSHEGDVGGKAFRDLSPVHRDVVEQPAGDPFQGHIPLGAGLEMGMAGDGGAAVGTVVEDDVVRELDGEVQHVRIAVPDGLGHVHVARNHEVVREDGRPVHQDAVFPALAAFEREEMLMLEVVLLAQRTAVVEDGHPARIRLEGGEDAADGHLAGLGALEGAVLRRDGRPDRQLVMDEFVDVDCHTG